MFERSERGPGVQTLNGMKVRPECQEAQRSWPVKGRDVEEEGSGRGQAWGDPGSNPERISGDQVIDVCLSLPHVCPCSYKRCSVEKVAQTSGIIP